MLPAKSNVQINSLSVASFVYAIKYSTVEPLKTDTLLDEHKCPSYRGVSLIEVIFNRNCPLGHFKVSVLERCPSYGMSVLTLLRAGSLNIPLWAG